MKILVVCYEFPPLGGGGGKVARDVATALGARGHEVCVQTSAFRGLPKQEVLEGITVHRNKVLRRRAEGASIFGMGIYVLASFPPAFRTARRFRPDVIHAHFAVPSGAVAYAVSKLLRIPFVITFHLGDVPGGAPSQTDAAFRIVMPFVRRIVAAAAALTAVSSFVRDLAERAFSRTVTVIPNGVSGRSSERSTSGRQEPIRLVFVGRFNSQKNLGLTLEALGGLLDQDWTLDLVGDGPDMAKARDLVSALRLVERVRFHGWVEPETVDRIMAVADVLLIPSKFEGMPVVAVNALRHGLAIVGSTAPGLADVLLDGVNGAAAPVDDMVAFRTGLAELMSDRQRLGAYQAASLDLCERFSLDRIVDSYEAVLARAATAG